MQVFSRDEAGMPELMAEVGRIALDFLADARDANVVNTQTHNRAIQSEMPEQGIGGLAALEMYWENYGASHTRSTGPRYFGFVTGGTTPAALAGDWLVSVLDQNVATERHSVAAFIEAQTLSFLADMLRLPSDAFHGVLTTGATAANLVGLATAREWCGEHNNVSIAQDGLQAAFPVMVFCASPHSSIVKDLGLLGIGQRNFIKVNCLPHREVFDLDALEQSLATCTSPCRIVVASAGTVNSGDFDDLVSLATLCKKYRAWLHVDAAFGAFARCSSQYAHLVEGLELADSITADAHKWLNVPYDCGIAFTRHVTLHERAFSADAPYVPLEGQLPAYMNRGVEQSRRYRALPLWMTLMAYGKAGYRELIERHCGYAQRIASWVDESPCFQLLCEVRLNLLVFRYFKDGCTPNTLAELNRQVLSNLNSSGELYITPTTYKGEYALRLSISNWMTQEEDINRVTAALQRAAD
ncbi:MULTISPECIES: pyridoxal-dependent decarboxylase [unclassified Pseudomonas]|uniref:pyridoxal phosphate-dependent decarboxylase family protein n=1 Tax=unclassified Pseudomonas TaxID=196821 RepID=UPI000881A509|nr:MULTISPECIES: pyridoxal-dependent decarboxylase [unclassified Pseudomonas]SCZ13867.1 Glutamate or tyrosine decarboxylase [Pseudomonas sp. NFACC37-1]SFP03676.1 Glutamate or tyrosine decarboxylase [Pseudomonas sp. NFACC24-1]